MQSPFVKFPADSTNVQIRLQVPESPPHIPLASWPLAMASHEPPADIRDRHPSHWTPPPADIALPDVPTWSGSFTPFAVGDPGRAASSVRPLPDPTEWHRPDTIIDGIVIYGDTGDLAAELRAASVRGLSHRYYGKVRQDHYAFECTPDRRYLVVALADGVSSSSHSHEAANIICIDGCSLLATHLTTASPDDLNWNEIIRQLSNMLVDKAARLTQEKERDVSAAEAAETHAATALFAVLELRPRGGRIVAHVLSVGDSSAWVLRGGNAWESLNPIKNEAAVIATSRTRALPSYESVDGPTTTSLDSTDVLILASDGIGDPLADGKGAVGHFLANVWAQPPTPIAFAAHVDFARKSHDDDRTVVAVWPEWEPDQ